MPGPKSKPPVSRDLTHEVAGMCSTFRTLRGRSQQHLAIAYARVLGRGAKQELPAPMIQQGPQHHRTFGGLAKTSSDHVVLSYGHLERDLTPFPQAGPI